MGRIDQEAPPLSGLVLETLKCAVECDQNRGDFVRDSRERKARPVAARIDPRCFVGNLAHRRESTPDDVRNGKKIAGRALAIKDR